LRAGGAQVPRTWRGRILAPEIPPSDSAACAYATMCPCLALGENYQRRVPLRGRGARPARQGDAAGAARTFRGAPRLAALRLLRRAAQSVFAAQVDHRGARAAVVLRHDSAVDRKRARLLFRAQRLRPAGGVLAAAALPRACVLAFAALTRACRAGVPPRRPSTGSALG
jgi:hypothetical protein